MSAPHSAMVMAAGLGTRMKALTRDRPKPLLHIGGRAMIDIALDHLAAAGVRRAVVNLHYKGEQIRDHLAARAAPEILFSEEAELLETGGGVVKALPLLGDQPFFVMNSDAAFTGAEPLPELARAWDGARMGALLLMVPAGRAAGHQGAGDGFLDEAGRLRFRGDAPSAPLIYTGAQIIAPEAFAGARVEKFSTKRIWDHLAAEGRLFGAVCSGGWVDAGTPEGLRLAEEALA